MLFHDPRPVAPAAVTPPPADRRCSGDGGGQGRLFAPPDPADEPMPWETAEAGDRLVARVVLNKPLMTAYSYLVPEPLRDALSPAVGPGKRVRVPFGRGDREESGFVVGLDTVAELAADPNFNVRRLKHVGRVLDETPLVSAKMLRLTEWIAERYLCGWGQVLHSVVPAGVKRKAGTRELLFFEPTAEGRAALEALTFTKKQRAVMEALIAAGEPLRADAAAGRAKCGPGVVEGLRRKGMVRAVKQRADVTEFDPPDVERQEDFEPMPEQATALADILRPLRAGEHETILLRGVTGSGKTEVYIRAIQEVVSYGRQAIVLVPEISLTPQTIRRFRRRFDGVAVLHSHLSDAERYHHWKRIAAGKVEVVVGARSAIFAPTPHLGIVIIDEEHEHTFKQESVPRYHARDVAEQRCRTDGVPLVLGSATPTLESWHAAQEGAYRLVTMEKRVENRPLPPVITVDVRNDPQVRRGQAIGRQLTAATRNALEDGGQVIYFLNLRGFSPALWCRACGASVKCPNCDVTLTWHKDKRRAVCHTCDHEQNVPKFCPDCGQAGLKLVGVGTQKLEEEVRAKFPDIEIARMDSDSMRKPGSHDEVLGRFKEGGIDLLLGTQMIAKGLDFPNVTLVGVIDADTLLHQPDLRAGERTFQLIAQVAGRTGRSARGGRVFVQTCSPGEPAIARAREHDYLGFVGDELRSRYDLSYPPYRRLCRVILRGENESEVKGRAREMAELFERRIKQSDDTSVRVLGPAPCPIARLQKLWRYHFQLSAPDAGPLRDLWRAVEPDLPAGGDVEFVVDVDPLNMR